MKAWAMSTVAGAGGLTTSCAKATEVNAGVVEWYTRATQNRMPTRLEGSSPSSGTSIAYSFTTTPVVVYRK